jgi:CBS-domain-containing membrane protein
MGNALAAYALPLTIIAVVLLLLAEHTEVESGHDAGFESTYEHRTSRSSGDVEMADLLIARNHTATREWIAGGLALLAVGVGYFEWQGRRAMPKYGRRRGDLPSAESDTHDESSRNRLAQKRLKILGMMVSDNHKLLSSDLTVGDLMTTIVRTAEPTTSVGELRALIAEYKIRHILICNQLNELVGVVSDRDLRRASEKLVASDLMAECPTTVKSDSLLSNAITLLLYGHISSLPVVDEGRLVGILTTTDVVMTLQCTLLAVEQMVRDLGAGQRAPSAGFSAAN